MSPLAISVSLSPVESLTNLSISTDKTKYCVDCWSYVKPCMKAVLPEPGSPKRITLAFSGLCKARRNSLMSRPKIGADGLAKGTAAVCNIG